VSCTYIGAVELPVPDVIFLPVIFVEPVSIVDEPISLSAVVGPRAIVADVKVPAIKEAVARILAIANK
jgi:hypothetical protein